MNERVNRFIGDIHGDFHYYKQVLLSGVESSVQVGDYGLGFNKSVDAEMLKWADENRQHKFIRGNHDNKTVCQTFPNYIPDGYFDHQNKILYIGGAWSIDYWARKEGINYWADEECSTQTLSQIILNAVDFKPRIIVSHDAPDSIPTELQLHNPAFGGPVRTRTGAYLEFLFSRWKPELWIFGHWHKSSRKEIGGTKFICLGINEFVDINLDTLEMM